jgi:hypothetical protein
VAVEHGADEGHERREHHRPARVVERPVRQLGEGGQHEHSHGSAAAHQERGRPGHQQQDGQHVDAFSTLLRVRPRQRHAERDQAHDRGEQSVLRDALQPRAHGAHESICRAHV